MKLGIYTCTITSAEEALEEYASDINLAEKEASCWIASAEGQPFKVDCGFGGTVKGAQAMRITLSADGELLDTRIAVDCQESTMNGIRTDSWTVLPFLFKEHVKPAEDYDEEDMDVEDMLDSEAWKQRGVIKLEMTRVEAVRFQPIPDADPSSTMPAEERLRTILVGQKDTSPRKAARRQVSWSWGEDNGEPIATFYFKHRPKEWLQNYGFIPRDNLMHAIDFGAFSLNAQPEYITGMRQMTLQDQVMS